MLNYLLCSFNPSVSKESMPTELCPVSSLFSPCFSILHQQGGPSRQDFDSDRDRRMMKSDMRGRDFARGADIGGPPSMGSVNKFGNTYGLSTVFLESLGITGTLVNKVFVANVSVW